MNNFYSLSEKALAYFTRSAPITAVLVRAALVCSLYLCSNGDVAAQPNCTGYNGPMITNFADWDWTIPTNDPNYCATWTVVLTRDATVKLPVGAPWFSFQNGAVDKINVARDYTKAKGWELLRMNMGGRQPVKTAHFILYNKYSGIIRAFFYIHDVAPFTKGMTITMSHTSANGGRNSGILALSQPLTQSQDYYLQNQSLSSEFVSYVPVFSGREGWVYGDFQAGFDSYAGNARYSSTSLQFSVSAVTSSTVRLDGALNFKTAQDVQNGGYGVGGAAASAGTSSGLSNFFADGQKVLTAFNYEDLTKFKSNFTTKADRTAATVPLPVVQTQQADLKTAVASSSSSGGLLKKISGIAGSLGSAFGLISTVIGVLWPDESATPAPAEFIPTVSTGTLSLKGSISTIAPYTSFTMQIPGGQHFYPGSTVQMDGGNQPYYDCPLGIFNLKNTPQLALYRFGVYNGRNPIGTRIDHQMIYTSLIQGFNSFQVTNDLVAVYNDAAGLNIQSVQAAIVAETPTAVFKQSEFNRLNYPTPLPNLTLRQVYSGEIEVIAATDSLVTYATPFVDLGIFKNTALTARNGSKVYIRIKAVLQRKDAAADAPPVFFVQDYAIQSNVTAVASNPRFATFLTPDDRVAVTTGEAPFTNLASALVVPIVNPGTAVPYPDFTSTAPYLIPAGNYSSPLIVSSLTAISAGQTPFNPTSGSVTLNHPNTADRSLFLSTTGVALGPGFSVAPGTNFAAATPLQAWRQGGPALIEPFVGPCSYNSNTSYYNPVAYRGGKPGGTAGTAGPAVMADELALSPNPTDGLVQLSTAVTGEAGAVVVVSDYMGREVQRLEGIPAGRSNQQLNLAGKAGGLYFVRLLANGKTVTQKVMLQ